MTGDAVDTLLEAEPDRATTGATRIAEAFVVRREDGRSWIECAQCGHDYGTAERDPKLGTVVSEGTIDDLSPLNAWGLTDKLVVRSFFCPECAVLVAVDVQEKGDPIMLETRLMQAGG